LSVDRSVSYGFGESVDYRAQDVSLQDFSSVFSVFRQGQKTGEARLNVPGRHNVQNAVGVIALATELGIPFEKIAKALPKFRHARRRSKSKYASDRFLLVDDYAHHPTEIRATLAAARSTGRNPRADMFQPHRYTRTKALRQNWRCLRSGRSRCYHRRLSGERAAIPGISGQTIADAIQRMVIAASLINRVSLTSITTSATCWRRAISSLVSAREIFTSNYRFWRRSWWSRKN